MRPFAFCLVDISSNSISGLIREKEKVAGFSSGDLL